MKIQYCIGHCLKLRFARKVIWHLDIFKAQIFSAKLFTFLARKMALGNILVFLLFRSSGHWLLDSWASMFPLMAGIFTSTRDICLRFLFYIISPDTIDDILRYKEIVRPYCKKTPFIDKYICESRYPETENKLPGLISPERSTNR